MIQKQLAQPRSAIAPTKLGTVEDVQGATVSVALAPETVSGLAFVAGPGWAIDYLIQHARPFVFSTAPPPPIAAALDASITVIQQEPERRHRLMKHSALLRNLLTEAGIDVGRSNSQIIPIVLGENERACKIAAELQQEGFDVRAIRPPSVPSGTARLRVSVNAGLEESTIRRFARAVLSLPSVAAATV